MSSSTALKASKSIVESYVSSTEKSDLTTSFTSNSSVSENDSGLTNGIMEKVMIVFKHPKFKWIVIAILLCVCAFIYFKTQKKSSKSVKEDTRKDKIDVKLNKNGRPELVEKDKSVKFEFKDKNLQKKLEDLDNKQQQQFLMNHMQQMNQQPQPQHQHHMPQAPQAPPVLQVPKVPQQPQVPQVSQQPQAVAKEIDSDETESDEVFIENENIMNHNLTMEEMNAIDKQLEDVLE